MFKKYKQSKNDTIKESKQVFQVFYGVTWRHCFTNKHERSLLKPQDALPKCLCLKQACNSKSWSKIDKTFNSTQS